MKFAKYIIVVLLLLVVFSCTAEDRKNSDRFEGVWCIKSQTHKITEFIIIQKIEGNYLVVVADVDDNAVNKGIGKKIDSNTMQYEMWGNVYTLDWFQENNGEWLEEYIGHRMEDYPIFKRVETFTLDKF